jgi:V/A-type H+-transporting ATPase subunit G/H
MVFEIFRLAIIIIVSSFSFRVESFAVLRPFFVPLTFKGGVKVAKEAVELVKKAEEEAQALLEQSRMYTEKTMNEAKISAKEKYKQIITDAKAEAENIKKKAEKDTQSKAQPIIIKGKEDADTIRNMNEKELTSAINIVIERIVKTNGNS